MEDNVAYSFKKIIILNDDILFDFHCAWICTKHSFFRNDQKYHLKRPETKQEEFKALVSDAARRFLGARTDRFVNEVELFLASGLNIEAYDAVYMQRLGWSYHGVTSEASEGAAIQQTPLIPYLYIFDEDSDGPDWISLQLKHLELFSFIIYCYCVLFLKLVKIEEP